MRRFPFFLGPLLGLVALFFLFKLLFTAMLGLAVFGLAFMAVRAIKARRFYPDHPAATLYRPVPVDGGYREQGFPYGASQQRIVEII